MEHRFRSSRLLYRAIEDTEKDSAFMYNVQADVVTRANAETGLLKPLTKKGSAKHLDYAANKTLLGVIICLSPDLSSPVEPYYCTPVGSMYLKAPKTGEEHHRNSYITIDIIAGHQRKGYGSEAIAWLLDWGFRIAGLHRIGIESFSWNEGASRLYERLGFVLEGRKRECFWFNGVGMIA